MTVLELIREEAAKAGVECDDKLAEHILWSQTGYPAFWPDPEKTPEQNLRDQLSLAFGKMARGEKLYDAAEEWAKMRAGAHREAI